MANKAKRPLTLLLGLALTVALGGTALALQVPLAGVSAAPAEQSAESESAPAAEYGETESAPAEAGVARVFLGAVSTRVDETWECAVTYPANSKGAKSYETMLGNVLHLTVYSSIPADAESDFYLALDSHIQYLDGTDLFAMTGRSGEYYCYEKDVRVTGAGSFELTVANLNTTLYSGVYDTVDLTVHDRIDALDFFVEQSPDNADVTHFFVTANGSATAIITPDTLGFNSTDNEWKIVTAEKSEKVLFEGTRYNEYTFHPDVTRLNIETEALAAEPTSMKVYYLGLVNGKLITVGPYTYPARTNTYSSRFELERTHMESLASEGQLTFYAYIESGRTADISVTDAGGVAHLAAVERAESDRDGLDKIAITVSISDTANDLDLLVGNRWSVNQVAYNYRTLHVTFLRQISSLAVTANPNGHYEVVYNATVNGRQELDTKVINWYVNDELQPEHGLALEHYYTQGGTYRVYAQLGDLSSNTVTTEIIYSDYQAVVWYALAAICLLACAWAVRRHYMLAGTRQDARLHEQLGELLARVEGAQVAMARGKLTDRGAKALLRGLRYPVRHLAENLRERFRATNMAAYKNAAAAMDDAVAANRKALRSRGDSYYLRAVLDTHHRSLRTALEALDEVSVLGVK